MNYLVKQVRPRHPKAALTENIVEGVKELRPNKGSLQFVELHNVLQKKRNMQIY